MWRCTLALTEKKPPVPMSRLEHYAGQDEIGLRYNSHRTKTGRIPVDEWR